MEDVLAERTRSSPSWYRKNTSGSAPGSRQS